MSAFLFDTLLWTGVLIAAVLLVRRPVARTLGSRAAYALWALPMLRLLLPPLVLPAWMAPAAREPEAFLSISIEAGPTLAEPASTMAEPAAVIPEIPWGSVLLTIWLAGATIFLLRRYALYFRMRRELLTRARPVGETHGLERAAPRSGGGLRCPGDRVLPARRPGRLCRSHRAVRDILTARTAPRAGSADGLPGAGRPFDHPQTEGDLDE